MLFTTATFVLLYLPLTLAGFFLIGRRSPAGAAGWLLFASLVFYGYWMPAFTLLLLASIGVNFGTGLRILGAVTRHGPGSRQARAWMVAGIVFNLSLLAYFKYANFLVDNLQSLVGTDWEVARVLLPIGISFYTFTQIAFLVDTWRGKVREANIVHYGLFVTYFPHLIAGPVLHHAQMMPQFADRSIYRPRAEMWVPGLLLFAIGLCKKIVLADGVAPYADAVFNPVDAGAVPATGEAWLGAVAYTLQLYFDFSGYSDMAIGLSWMFNVRLPYNFDSPYKATSISDFWRRWHISLSNFLRDYLYIALGGNRRGEVRRYANLLITMLLGGLWHGASWSFVAWGGAHGLLLVLHHGWRAALPALWMRRLDASRTWSVCAWALTLLCVVLAWVPFRAVTWDGALRLLGAMVWPGSGADEAALLWNAGLGFGTGWLWCGVLGAIAVLAPNSIRIGEWLLTRMATASLIRATAGAAALCAVLFLVIVNAARDSVSAFIYFNF